MQNNTENKKFDEKLFYKKIEEHKDTKILLRDSTIIFQEKISDNLYREQIKKKDSPYTVYRAYDKKTRKYIGGGAYFYSFPVGNWYTYDTKGNLIGETNEDDKQHFPFTVENLINKFRKDYEVDMSDTRKVRNVSKNVIDRSSYIIHLYVNSPEDYAIYEVDGKTGAVLSKIKAKDIEQGIDF